MAAAVVASSSPSFVALEDKECPSSTGIDDSADDSESTFSVKSADALLLVTEETCSAVVVNKESPSVCSDAKL